MPFWDWLSSDWSKNQAQIPVQDRQGTPENSDYDDMKRQIEGIGKVAGAANDALKTGGGILSTIGETFKGFATVGLGLGGSANSSTTIGDVDVNSGGAKIPVWLYVVGAGAAIWWIWKK